MPASPSKDPRIDAYIANAAPFARPILKHLRKVVHAGCPAVTETMKWSMPHFDYKGVMCGMAAHKQHCSFGFWQAAALALGGKGEDADSMGQFGRITSIADLPDEKTLIGYVRKAAALKDGRVKPEKPVAKPRAKAAPLQMPDYLANALKSNATARKTWDGFSPSHRNEYIEWLNDAKQDATRERRLETTLEWLAEGKSRNWKYQPNAAERLSARPATSPSESTRR
jgi:uncharacterized protein YdeI (YjbR/CyaY-like superfamily)